MEHRSAYNRLTDFIQTNRGRMPDKANNTFAMAFSQCSRYYYDLEIIQDRYHEASRDFMENTEVLRRDCRRYDYARSVDVSQRLHLEIESFYLFAKLFLDRVADAFAFFFDFRWGGRGSTHSKLADKYDGKRAYHIYLPTLSGELRQLIAELKQIVIEHKTDVIEHIQEAGMMHATTYTSDGKTRIMPNVIYGSADDVIKYVEQQSLTPDEILQRLDTYVAVLLAFLEAHIDQSPLISPSC
jgi:hypothetical protein